jgi:hypothetical protein
MSPIEREDLVTDGLALVLSSQELLTRIDAALARQDPERRGWALVDAARPDLPAVHIHARPFLLEPRSAPGLRVESETRPLRPEELPPKYGLVLLASDPGDMDEAALQALRSAVERQRSTLCLYSPAGAAFLMSQEGRLVPLPAAPASLGVGRIHITLRGREDLDLVALLPKKVRVRGAEPRATFFVRSLLSPEAGESFERFEVVSRDGSPVGEALLCLDLGTDGQADRLVITPWSGEDRILVRHTGVLPPPPPLDHAVRLHVIFDRTTLDREAWERALAVANRWTQNVVDLNPTKEGRADRPQREWNHEIRTGLAMSMRETVPKLHRRVILDLWWFADAPRPGMAPSDGLPTAPAAWGHLGTRRLENLSDALLATDFDYACGMDLFDAADEALEQVAHRIRDLTEESHAVLIVGDSPPPAADEQDPLWQRVVDGPPRTNARRSPKFRDALARLRREEIPVGWLFVRHPKNVNPQTAKERERALLLEDYPRFQTLRERVLAALQQQPGLLLEDCDGVEDFERSLGALFQRMRKVREAVSRLSIEEA